MAAPATPPTPTRPLSGHRPLLGVSTKMYFTHARTTAFTRALLTHLTSTPRATEVLSSIDAFLIPDFISLPAVLAAITTPPLTTTTPTATTPVRPPITIGAQDCAAADFGPLTGEVSPAVLREVGCGMVELGHAERRALFGEADGDVAAKARAVVRNGMVPLVCVGEKEKGGGGGEGGGKGEGDGDGVRAAAEEVGRQVAAVLEGLDPEAEVVLAYEPVWAIGAPEPASAAHVKGVVRRLRESEVVKGRKGLTRIVYGGAAGPGLWGQLGGEVDGLFLGRFAHQPEQFVKMLYEVPNDKPPPKRTFLPIAGFRQPISGLSMEDTPVRMPEAIKVAKLQMAEDGGLPSSVHTGKTRFFQPVNGFGSTHRTGVWGGFVSSVSAYLNELRHALFIQALSIYSFVRIQLRKLAGAVTKLAGPAGFAIACVALWSALSSMHDTRQALALAQWTARKDFLQYCHSVRETNRSRSTVRPI
ncbi:Triosephosphate isomerase [Chaetomium tenue]|uniref:Triosephosphate isomerase n=1 Tax=Chaetomium tenue TaxID=1854479 RepID=A0ACB7P9F1_9PEZI|nr:Triosephosphate isomerase [Chaetomium globosum]